MCADKNNHIPRVVIAGTHSGCGKTSVSIGVMSALASKGYKVQGFKAGPDYIDPSHHTYVTGLPSRNLDSWMVQRDKNIELFFHSAKDADISIVEGVMGMFDGYGATDEHGSTAHTAKLLNAPVILVIDAKAMARSSAAMVHGYKTFDSEIKIVGVIANKIAGENHFDYVKTSIEKYTDTPVLGYLKNDPSISIEERHLGLIPSIEGKTTEDIYHRLTENVLEHIDVDLLLELANDAGKLPDYKPSIFIEKRKDSHIKVGVARDQAFNFYYEDNLDILRHYGAEIIFFSPLVDKTLPEGLDFVYIGGGFPELFAEQLADNNSFKASIRAFADTSKPIYAECGGLMYLCQSIQTFDGKVYPMVGILPAKSKMMPKRMSLGYVTINVIEDNLLSKKGEIHRGHEFHWSDIEVFGNVKYAYETVKRNGQNRKYDGLMVNNVLASYTHLHFASNLSMVERFIENRIR